MPSWATTSELRRAAVYTRYKEWCAENGYAFVGREVYTVAPGDNLWRIAERKLGSGTRYTDIRALNGLTSNCILIGMKLLLP